MTFDPNFDRPEHQPVAYGASRMSNGAKAALFFGAIFAVGIFLFASGLIGTSMEQQANNPSAKIEGERATVPGAGTTGQGSPGGNWDTRLNKDEPKAGAN